MARRFANPFDPNTRLGACDCGRVHDAAFACNEVQNAAESDGTGAYGEIAEQAVQRATNSFKRNWLRVRDLEGLPIETLQSIQALDQARREYLRALVDYNTAQFRLQRALGWPIDLAATPKTLIAATSESS
jgi:hypothetical protein